MLGANPPVGLIRTPKKVAFLAALEETGNLHKAAEVAGCHISSHYAWLKDDAAYPEMARYAMEIAIGKLENEARRRAVEGVTEPVYQGGKLVGEVQKYSDVLLIFLLKGALPEKYREQLNVSYDMSQLSTEDLKQLDDLTAKVIPITAHKRRG